MKLKLLISPLLLSIILIILTIETASAQALGTRAFGGRITMVQVCATSGGFLITVGAPRGGMFMLMPSSRRHTPASLIIPTAGQSILGLAGTATVPCTNGPVTSGAGFPILMAGASMR